jgi:Tol biopolymer transport system component
MKRVTRWITLALLLVLGAQGTQAQSGYDLYQKALVKERAVGNVEEALRLYQQIVKDFGGNRALAAKAQLRLGLLYERLGRKAEAQRAFQALVNQYADQREAAAQARARLAVLSPAANNETANKVASGPTTRQVWAGPDVDPEGEVSPDGRYLSFVDWETGDLAIRELATGKKQRLTNKGSWLQSVEFALFSIVSPDSKQVAYTWFDKDGHADLRIIGSDGSAARVLYRSSELRYIQPADWSPDGKSILAFSTREDRTNQIVLIATTDGSVRSLKNLDWREPEGMCFSPDGRYIAYDFPQKEDKPERDIFLLALDGNRELTLIKHAANDLMPVWTPDGKRLIFASDRTGTLCLWAINVGEGKTQGAPEMIKSETGRGFRLMGFTRAGDYFYALAPANSDVYVSEVDWVTGKLLSPPTSITERFVGSSSNPAWSPDGQSLAFLSRRHPTLRVDSLVLVIRSVRTGEGREFSLALKSCQTPRWSPDGRFISVIGEDRKSRQGIYRIDAQTGEITPLSQTEPEIYIGLAVWSSDGKTIYYSINDNNTKSRRLLARELETGQERELYRGTVFFALSPDGKQVASIERNQSARSTSLMVIPVTGGVARELLTIKDPESIINNALAWTSDGRHLLFVKLRSNEQQNEVWRLPVSGGESQKTALAMKGLRNIHVHPDGRRIAFVAGEPKAEVWVTENFLPATPVRKTSVTKR